MAGCCEAGLPPPSPSSSSEAEAARAEAASLGARVGFVGRRGAGTSTLIRALSGQPLFPWADPWAYFRQKGSPLEGEPPAAHRFFPQLALHDLGPLPPRSSAPPLLPLPALPPGCSLRCLVLVLGPEEEAEEPLLRALRRAAPRAALLLVRSRADAQRHSDRRRAGLWGRPAGEGPGLERARRGLEAAMAREGLDPRNAFLLSALEPRRYDFARFEQRLALEALSIHAWGRGSSSSPQDSPAGGWKKRDELCRIFQPRGLPELPSAFRSALEDPAEFRLEVALLGEAGPRKSRLLCALRGGTSGGEGEEEGWPPGKAGPLPLPIAPRAFLWDLPWGEGLDLGRYDLFLLLDPPEGEAHQRLATAIASAGKEAFLLVKSKAKAPRGQGGGTGPPPRIFLLGCSPGGPNDTPLLLQALRSGAPGWKRQALRRALPGALSLLVGEQAGALTREAWDRALDACLCPPREAAAELLSALGDFRQKLGLEHGETLGAEARSAFARPMAPEALLGLVARPPSLGSWAWSFVPFFGWGAPAEAQVSFAVAYGMLRGAVAELSEDAERVLQRALLED